MLRKEEEVEATVTWEDQQRINSFSWLNNRKHEIADEIKELKEEALRLDDAATELMMAMDDAPAKFLIGEVFVEMSSEEADERLQKEKESAEAKIVALGEELEGIENEMKKLKVELYGKFKNSINLEDD